MHKSLLSVQALRLERTLERIITSPFPCSTMDVKEHSVCDYLARHTLFCALLFTLRLAAKPHIRSEQCSKLVADVGLSKQNVHLKKELNTVYFGWRELWNTQISQKFHILFTPSVPCIHPLFQLTHLLLMPLLGRLWILVMAQFFTIRCPI